MKRKPKCECHGEPMTWNKRAALLVGGYWKCTIEARAQSRVRMAAMRARRKAEAA